MKETDVENENKKMDTNGVKSNKSLSARNKVSDGRRNNSCEVHELLKQSEMPK